KANIRLSLSISSSSESPGCKVNSASMESSTQLKRTAPLVVSFSATGASFVDDGQHLADAGHGAQVMLNDQGSVHGFHGRIPSDVHLVEVAAHGVRHGVRRAPLGLRRGGDQFHGFAPGHHLVKVVLRYLL